ncbi:MAG: LysR family transcriptional regulator [Methylobacterium frigidaeris]
MRGRRRMQNWDGWQTLLAVARAGQLGTAAAALGIDATTAGRRIRRLEAEVGRPLLARRGGLLVPTRACLDLMPGLDAAERALRGVGEAARGEAGGAEAPGWQRIRITAVPVLCDHLLAPAVPRLVADRPRLGVELIPEERNLSLTRREADLALRLGPLGTVPREAREIGRLAYASYAASGCEAPDALPWACLDGALGHLPEVRAVERAAGRAGPRHRAGRLESLRRLVVAGGVRGLLPRIMAEDDPRLARLDGGPVLDRPVYLLGHPEDAGVPVIRAAAAWIEALVGV